ncbi:helical backbone metal receptor [Desulfosporosinus metallidurans]|uniref:Vitamin B12 ABC transporter, B12-binding component BtuF n=1 Tax=Desulfosporosinus metallidurans TaxID=1888891 RepID=A0A1Q8QSA5_9FIRM|nr:helical backbone metal receptor [Desulfosporosinus metallidurans]OLN30231.1 Vitamin B12 ABC transporter, B12-binding component BtuF [Desulfosporosinus metallidurans]
MKRIISLVPSHTEILYFLGLQTQVVGVTEHCNFPEDAKAKDKVGTFGQPQLMKILSLKPDLLLADQALHKKLIAELENTEIKVLASTPSRVDDVFVLMSELARICGTEISAQPVINSLRERVRNLRRRSQGRTRRVFYLMSTDPIVTQGTRSIQYDALRIAGAQLMDFQSEDFYVRVLRDQIKEFDPEVIFFCGIEKGQSVPSKCSGCVAKNPICQRTVDDIITKDWEQITAVREKRVYPIPCHTICRPGPRLIEGMEKLQEILIAR